MAGNEGLRRRDATTFPLGFDSVAKGLTLKQEANARKRQPQASSVASLSSIGHAIARCPKLGACGRHSRNVLRRVSTLSIGFTYFGAALQQTLCLDRSATGLGRPRLPTTAGKSGSLARRRSIGDCDSKFEPVRSWAALAQSAPQEVSVRLLLKTSDLTAMQHFDFRDGDLGAGLQESRPRGGRIGRATEMERILQFDSSSVK